MKKFERKDKNEKRRLAFEKRNVKKEMNLARYGAEGGSALIMAKSADFNRRFVAAFLALVFAISTIVLGINFATKAEDTQQTQAVTKGASSNLVVDKTISLANDNTYTLTLSAYAKGAIKNVTTQIPTDYVLVVDQSGSMDTEDMPTDYVEATMPSGGWTFDDFENGTDEDGNTIDRELYVKVDNKYYRVYRKWGQLYEYQPRNTIYAKDVVDSRALHWFADEQGTESTFNSQYYYQPSSDQNVDLPYGQYLYDKIQPGGADDDNFYPVNISSQGRTLYYSIRFNYYDSTGTKRYLRYVNNTTNSTANKDKETGNCIWYRDPDKNYFGPGDTYYVTVVPVTYSFANDFVLGWIDSNRDYDSFYTYGQITSGFQAGMYIQNPLFIGHVGYNSLAYRDAEGEEHIISHTDYCNANDEPTNDKEGTIAFSDSSLTLYEATGTKLTRLEAVQNALNEFVSTVASQTDDSGVVDHRVAIVGFSSDGFNNNELLTNTYNNFSVNHTAAWTNENGSAHYSSNGYAHDGVQKASADSTTAYYGNALISAHADDDDGINDALPDGISGLTAHGGTQPGTGLEMAYKILQLNDKSNEYAAGTRNAVVIFFTDGRPGNYSYVNQYDEANTVVGKAYTIKSEISNVQIYSVGVFGEADGNPLTYQNGNAGPYYYYGDLEEKYNTLYCNNYGSSYHTTADQEKVFSNCNISDVSIGRVYSNAPTYWPRQIEETYYPDYAKTTSAFYGNATVSWTWNAGGVLGLRSHTASDTIPTYRLSFYWRDHMRNSTNYPKVENDTIFDYMTVVSSSYPEATSFDNGWSHLSRSNKESGNYNSFISNVRQDKGPGRYYMSASDSANLNEIFVNIASEATTSTIPDTADLFLQDVISDNFDLPANPENHVTAVSYIGTQAIANGAITFSDTPTTDHFATNWTDKKLVVSGFSFSENYIMNGKPANNNQGTKESQGKKLEVTITGLTPSDGKTGDALKSNVETADSDSGISGIMENDDGSITCIEPFISPSITRHSYQLSVSDNPNGKFDLATAIMVNGSDEPVAINDANLSDVVLVAPDGTRARYSTSNETEFRNKFKEMGNRGTFYYENVPTGYLIRTSIKANDDIYDYTWNLSPPVTLSSNDYSRSTFAYEDTTLDISSVAKSRDVTLNLTVDSSPYVDTNYEFKVDITLSGNNIADKLNSVTTDNPGISFTADGTDTLKATVTMPYKEDGTIDPVDIKVPDGAVLSVAHSDYFYTTDPIKYTDADVTSQTEYTAHEIIQATNIYINDTHRDNVGEGIAEDSNPMAVVLYALGGIFVVSVAGTGVYVYRRKREER